VTLPIHIATVADGPSIQAPFGRHERLGANTIDGTRRVYWELSGAGSLGNPVPSTTELYTIEWFRPTQERRLATDRVADQGVDGETFPMEALIPWAALTARTTSTSELRTAHGELDGHSPAAHAGGCTYAAGANGIYMWLGGHTSASWLYAKWDYGWPVDHTWSALRLTQVTPEPISMLLFGLVVWPAAPKGTRLGSGYARFLTLKRNSGRAGTQCTSALPPAAPSIPLRRDARRGHPGIPDACCAMIRELSF